MGSAIKKCVFGVTANSKDPDQPAGIHSYVLYHPIIL